MVEMDNEEQRYHQTPAAPSYERVKKLIINYTQFVRS